jgi:hypothetical protein
MECVLSLVHGNNQLSRQWTPEHLGGWAGDSVTMSQKFFKKLKKDRNKLNGSSKNNN